MVSKIGEAINNPNKINSFLNPFAINSWFTAIIYNSELLFLHFRISLIN